MDTDETRIQKGKAGHFGELFGSGRRSVMEVTF
jgi:hypothetical protein